MFSVTLQSSDSRIETLLRVAGNLVPEKWKQASLLRAAAQWLELADGQHTGLSSADGAEPTIVSHLSVDPESVA